MYRVLMTSQFFRPGFKAGGPIRSVSRIVDTVPPDVDLTLITSDRDLGDSRPYPGLPTGWALQGPIRVFRLNEGDQGQALHLVRDLRARAWDLMYVNSLFNPRYSLAPVLAARLGMITARRVLIAPRGELSQGALGLKSGKKAAFLKGWLRLLATMNVRWHATSDQEAADIRAAAPDARIEVCQDRGDGPAAPLPVADPAPIPRLAFVSRISPMKNLQLALEALVEVTTSAQFDIYGPVGDPDYWRHCQKIMDRMSPTIDVTYRGELDHEKVRPTLNGYDAMLLPTLGENFGHIIAEALSASCPVICSDRTPWTSTLLGGGGAVVAPLTTENYRATVDRVLTATVQERRDNKIRAGAAYVDWKAGTKGRNIIGQVLGL
jgi:glycosyltransferase involved in cell wall biosynthesis